MGAGWAPLDGGLLRCLLLAADRRFTGGARHLQILAEQRLLLLV